MRLTGNGDINPPGTSASYSGGFKKRNLMAAPGGFNGCCTTGPTGSNDGNCAFEWIQTTRPKAWVFQASQNLRSGVRLTRWCKT